MNCTECGQPIPEERLEALPETTCCVKCSQESGMVGITVWDDGVPSLVTVSKEEAERHKALERIDGRLGRLK